VRVDIDALLAIARHHDDFSSEAGAFDVKLEPITLGVSVCGAAGAAGALGPAAADLVLIIGRELTDEIKIVAVAGAPQLQLDVAFAGWAIRRVAAYPFGRAVLRT